ncbi:PREDICTED: centromere/kinetochore protein zw10 isoform X1 [Rhagoletis zephyria]|uniref:centromere/kinetochore protein zw10 isoform X1 n=1 Tax=Rhagoletis zephyria TaxID=28612 RepID=UPI0008112484|nr:PREDICTED: centromere/kinetochore protein zw10 isoform X1 [Rhagoletis zephyria]XP_017470646.1 PREDICTED: centromere/kinetochore protein zw10 isoform X1 [Rhagoletis zephyria]
MALQENEMQYSDDIVKILRDGNGGDAEVTKSTITKILSRIKRYQERIRKHIEDNYIEFMPNQTTSDAYLDEGEQLVRESEHLLQTIGSEANAALRQANSELGACIDEFREMSLGLRVSFRILKVDDLFQCVEEANSNKEYLVVLDHLGKLKSLIYSDGGTDVDRVFQKCECYNTIKVKYHIQANILKQNLQQRFELLVQFTEKPFSHSKYITLQVSKDVNQLQDTVMALFQARYNPIKICDFLLENCLEPLILKPVSLDYSEENPEHVRLTLSYSLKEMSRSLRPSYKKVFENIKLLLNCLANINVSVSNDQQVFSIIGDHIKQRFLNLLVEECLMHAIPKNMSEYDESTLVEDVVQFEHFLADAFLINSETDKALSDFAEKFESYFREQFSNKLIKSALDIMHKDLQDMALIAEKNSAEDVAKNPFLFPCCMVSKSTLELIKLMERILRQSHDTEDESLLNVISVILISYVGEVPKIHEKLLESIPQQSALFYNNCQFLAHWVTTNSEKGIPTYPALVKTLHMSGSKYLNVQINYQQKIIMGILKEFDISDAHTVGTAPLKLLRQCLRQLDLLKNVWQNVLPDAIYNKTFCDIIHDFCNEIIRRILAMEDISATVASELSELISVILEKVPTLFKHKHEVIHIKSWMKLEQLKMILNASLQEITEQWCEGAGILTANYKAEEIKHLIRALFQNTDRRAKALTKIV